MITLPQILELVGPLDDSPGEHTARERFRKYLATSVLNVGAVRDYIETCLRSSGMQYNRALQDLVNHTGRLIGFNVEFGRYQGVQGEIGFDGVWRLGQVAIVIEVKTSDVYAIKTATLLNYINSLISDGRIPDRDHALGLYVFGRIDAEIKQLEHAIVAQKQVQQLRVATVESILSLAELVQENYLSRDEAVVLLQPVGVSVDDIVGLMTRVTAKPPLATEPPPAGTMATIAAPAIPAVPTDVSPSPEKGAERPSYLLTPVADDKEATAEEIIRSLLGQGWYVFGEKTPGRKNLKPGDRLCFYRAGMGIVAEATVGSYPERQLAPGARQPEKFPWRFRTTQPRYFFNAPIVLDAALRSQLDAFRGRDSAAPWAWFVQGTHEVSEHDFLLLVHKEDSSGSLQPAQTAWEERIIGRTRIVLKRGDIVKEQADVIVNAANERLQAGTGVNGAILAAGGTTITTECNLLRAQQGGCKPGEAVVTSAGQLMARYIVHAVGPR